MRAVEYAENRKPFVEPVASFSRIVEGAHFDCAVEEKFQGFHCFHPSGSGLVTTATAPLAVRLFRKSVG